MNKLTDVGIRAVMAKPRTGRVELPDGAVPGLTLRIGKARGATWSLMIRVVGEGGITDRGHALVGPKRRLTLGTYPQVSLHAARAKASAYLDQARRGESPIEALERAATGRLTVEGLAEKFLTDYVYLKQLRAAYNYEIAIRTHIVEGLGRVVADMLTRDQVRDLMKNVMVQVPSAGHGKSRRRGGIEAARSVMGVLRKMINWGIRERILKRRQSRRGDAGQPAEEEEEGARLVSGGGTDRLACRRDTGLSVRSVARRRMSSPAVSCTRWGKSPRLCSA